MYLAVKRDAPKVISWLLSLGIGDINDDIKEGYTALYFTPSSCILLYNLLFIGSFVIKHDYNHNLL